MAGLEPTSGDTAAKLLVPLSGQSTRAALCTLQRAVGLSVQGGGVDSEPCEGGMACVGVDSEPYDGGMAVGWIPGGIKGKAVIRQRHLPE